MSSTEDKKERDYDLATRLSRAGDDLMVGVEEVAAVMGLRAVTIRQRRLAGMPAPLAGIRILRWRLGDIRAWMRGRSPAPAPQTQTRRRRGRPTKAEQIHTASPTDHNGGSSATR